MPDTASLPWALGFEDIADGPGSPVLLVYGEQEFNVLSRGRRSIGVYQTVGLPKHGDGQRMAGLAPFFGKLKSRAVVICPEPTPKGQARAQRHAVMLAQAGAAAVGVIDRPLGPEPLELGKHADHTRRLALSRALPARAVAAWPAPLDAAAMFDAARRLLARVLDEPAATLDTIFLWCLHCWVLHHGAAQPFDVSPRLIFQANDARAGHGRALRVAAWLTPSPLVVSRTVASHLLPFLQTERPTLLLDDVAGGLLYRRDMRTLIAAGATRDTNFLSARTRRNRTGRLSCFAPAAIATASPLSEDLRLRAIVVPMAPLAAHDARAPLRMGEPPQEALTLRAQMQAFALQLEDAPPLDDTAQLRRLAPVAWESWAPLAAIAQRIGPSAMAAALEAAAVLSAAAPAPASNLALLGDIRAAFGADTRARIPTARLIDTLTADPELPWASAKRGRKIDPRDLAERLARFGVKPVSLKMADDVVVRGYRGEDLASAYARYLGEGSTGSSTVAAE